MKYFFSYKENALHVHLIPMQSLPCSVLASLFPVLFFSYLTSSPSLPLPFLPSAFLSATSLIYFPSPPNTRTSRFSFISYYSYYSFLNTYLLFLFLSVIAWAALPMCDEHLSIATGYKTTVNLMFVHVWNETYISIDREVCFNQQQASINSAIKYIT